MVTEKILVINDVVSSCYVLHWLNEPGQTKGTTTGAKSSLFWVQLSGYNDFALPQAVGRHQVGFTGLDWLLHIVPVKEQSRSD